MNTNIYIRADGNSEVGLGHLVRCIALGQMLKHNFFIYFVCKDLPIDLERQIRNQEFTPIRISSEEEFYAYLSGNEIVVLDHYELDTGYQKIIKSIGSKLACIDDLHDKEFFADLIINHSPGVQVQDYKAQSYTRFALGPDFALLRRLFLGAERKEEIITVNTVLICFGGSDYKNFTRDVLQVVKDMNYFNKIFVVLGAANSHRQSLLDVKGNDDKISILTSLSEKEMYKTMMSVDMAIIPASGISFEVIATGCIPLICYYAENQKKLFSFFKEESSISTFDAHKLEYGELIGLINKIIFDIERFKNIPLRQQIKKSSSNHLEKFRELESGLSYQN